MSSTPNVPPAEMPPPAPGTMYASHGPQPPARKSRAKWIATGTGVAGFLIGVGVGGASGNAPSTASAPTEAATVTVTAKPAEAAPAVTETIQVAGPTKTVVVTKQLAAPVAATAFEDGQYEIGTDVKPGKYKTKTKAEDNGGLCYVDVHNDAGTIAQQEVTPSGYTYLTIRSGQRGWIVKSSNCGEWVKVG